MVYSRRERRALISFSPRFGSVSHIPSWETAFLSPLPDQGEGINGGSASHQIYSIVGRASPPATALSSLPSVAGGDARPWTFYISSRSSASISLGCVGQAFEPVVFCSLRSRKEDDRLESLSPRSQTDNTDYNSGGMKCLS